MFGKLMNRFYYGKSGQGDFTKEDLPQTRWQLFWEMLKVRFGALCRLNLMYAIAWLPAIIIIGRGLLMAYSAMVSMADIQSQMAAGELAEAAGAEQLAQFTGVFGALAMQTLVLLVPAIAITGPFTAGLAYVTRNWSRDEHAFIFSDFMDAVKANWKQGLLTSVITGLVPLLLYVCNVFYGDMAQRSWVFLIPQCVAMVAGVLWLCALLYMYPQMVTYRLRYGQLVRNSLIMTISRLPQTVGLKLLSILPAVVCLLVAYYTPYAQYAMMVYGAYYILIGFALSRFVGASYSNAVFDRYLNPNIEGAVVNRGLYVDEDDDSDQPGA